MKDITDGNFENEVLKEQLPVVVFFHDDLSRGASGQVAPFVEKLAQEHAGKAKFLKVNVDTANDDIWSNIFLQYEVCAIPTFVAFHRGRHVGSLIGVQGLLGYKNQGLVNFVNQVLAAQ